MVYGPAPPKGSTKDPKGRTIVPPRFQGPVRPGTDVEKFRRTGRSKPRGGGGSSGSRARQAAEASRQAAAEKAAALKLAQEKAHAEGQAKIAAAKASAELARISALRAKIVRGKGSVAVKKSRDAATGDKLVVTEWKKNGNKVRRVFNEKTGEIKFTSYGVGRGGGATRKITGVTLGGTPKAPRSAINIAARVKIEPVGDGIGIRLSQKDIIFMGETNAIAVQRYYKNKFPLHETINPQDKMTREEMKEVEEYLKFVSKKRKKAVGPDKLTVTFPNGRKGTIKAKGTVIVGKELAGHKYTFKDGVIISVDGKTTGVREEFVPIPTVGIIEQPTGRGKKIINKLNVLQNKTSTSSIRNKQRNLKNELKLLGLTTATTVVAGVGGILALPSTLWRLIKKPSEIKRIPGIIDRGAKNFGRMIRISPTEVIGVVGGEVILFKGAGMTFKAVGKVSTKIKNIVRPVLNKVNKTRFTVNGNTIKMAGGTATTAESLAKQAARAGKKSVPVTALSDDIFNLIKRKRVVRKPIPGEALLSKSTKKLLRKFDSGKISRTEIIKLDRSIRIETKGAGSLLERATYADPAGRVRTSRLGLGEQKRATLTDILSGDFTFRTNKPQILVFDDIVVQGFPKNLKNIVRKLKSGKALTQSEMDKLLNFQLKKTGKFKPIGAVTKESEIVLAPGEIIKKVKTVGYVNVGGKRIPVTRVKVLKSAGKLKTLLNKFNKNKISSAELKQLERMLKSKTGFKSTVSRSGNSRPVTNFPGVIGARRGMVRRVTRRGVIRRVVKRRVVKKRPTVRKKRPTKRPPKRPTKRPPKRPMKRPPKRPPKRPTKRPPKRPTKRPPKRPPRRPPKRPPRKPPIIPSKLKKKFKKRTIPKKVPVFYIKIKRKGRIVNLTPRPLRLSEAKDLLAWSMDKNLVRTAYFEPLGKAKRVVSLPPKMRGYFTRNKRKFRPYKIRVGKKKQLRNGFIEKRRFALDTKRERAQIKSAKLKAKRKIAKKNVVKRKKTKRSKKR